jgi:hypothetical protein
MKSKITLSVIINDMIISVTWVMVTIILLLETSHSCEITMVDPGQQHQPSLFQQIC